MNILQMKKVKWFSLKFYSLKKTRQQWNLVSYNNFPVESSSWVLFSTFICFLKSIKFYSIYLKIFLWIFKYFNIIVNSVSFNFIYFFEIIKIKQLSRTYIFLYMLYLYENTHNISLYNRLICIMHPIYFICIFLIKYK